MFSNVRNFAFLTFTFLILFKSYRTPLITVVYSTDGLILYKDLFIIIIIIIIIIIKLYYVIKFK